jgi:hypothetical protein
MKLKVGDVVIANKSEGYVDEGDVLVVTHVNRNDYHDLLVSIDGCEVVWSTKLSSPAKKLHKYLYGVENGET